jgi:hypothetical protein
MRSLEIPPTLAAGESIVALGCGLSAGCILKNRKNEIGGDVKLMPHERG